VGDNVLGRPITRQTRFSHAVLSYFGEEFIPRLSLVAQGLD
jgi:hypothetical protein